MTEESRFDEQLEQSWQALSPPAELKARVRARLAGAALAPSAAPRVLSSVVRSSRWRALRASGRVGAGIGALLVGLGFAAGYWSARARPEAASAPAAAVARAAMGAREAVPTTGVALEAPATASTVEATLPPSAAAPAAPVRVAARVATTAARSEVAELELLQRAERAVRAQNHALALALTRELEVSYPRSELQEERRAIALMAGCQAGNSSTASARARFARQYPDSVYLDRVAAECDGIRRPR